ncbi:MAG TPA: ATP synthase F0 subunit B [Thermoanaerobaculia bacterium]|nr:ATP synthase F0 subunit B [Thermoanaerobaculia bacterium]
MNLVPDASLLVIMVIFWITYWLLRWALFGPVLEILRERRETVETAQAEHEAALAQTEARIEAERTKLNQARVEAAARRDELRRAAEERRQAVLSTSREEAERRLATAGEELDRTVATERRTLDGRARELAGRITEKLLEKSA